MADMITGILKRTKGGAGVLLDLAGSPAEIPVPAELIRHSHLVEGAAVSGPLRPGRHGPELAGVESVCGLSLEAFQQRTPFDHLVAIDPNDRFRLAASGEPSTRIIDLVAPIGKGARGLIVSPPKAGKTILLQEIAQAIRLADPPARIILLLIDERPEEVTWFRRSVQAEVFATSSDRSLQEHVALTELMLAHIRTELECGREVVVLLDSLTRLTRAFNLRGTGHGKSLSGGLEAGAVEIPRRFFGVARNIEGGGSVTILATTMIDTGSRLDQVIFEEFKGTGNSEIVLDRSLAEARLFPAINLVASSTRKAHLLYDPDDHRRLEKLRRALAGRSPRDALISLLKLLEQYPSNEAILQGIPL